MEIKYKWKDVLLVLFREVDGSRKINFIMILEAIKYDYL